MSTLSSIYQLPAILRRIEKGDFLPPYSYHLRGRRGRLLAISGGGLCYPLEPSGNERLLKEILLDVEDKRFYQHGAIDVKGIIRAGLTNLRAGRVMQGGSTITQQLARTLFLDTSRTWLRKFAEAIIAFKMEKHLSKEEIIDAYCNFVYMGKGTWGFEAASRVIYRRPFRSLSRSEIPGLVGLLGAPERFRPEANEDGYWHRAEQKAKQGNLDITVKRARLNPIRVSRVFNNRLENATRKELTRLNLSERDVRSIELTLDETLQSVIDTTLKKVSAQQGICQAAAVVICNRTGDVLAESAWMNGIETQFSPTFSGRLQPGSTFKTFALLAAIESGLSTEYRFESAPYCAADKFGKGWVVRNYGGQYRGLITLRDAFIESDNSVFARLSDCLDRKDLASSYARFALVDPHRFTQSAVLGGLDRGVTLLKIANAYATIARNGVAVEPRLLRFIEYQDGTSQFIGRGAGKVVCDYKTIQSLQRILAMSGITDGENRISGKTGTTKKASLFAGYNNDISIALWLDFQHEQPEYGPKALTAVKVAKSIGKKLLAWSERRAFEIV